jgi:hypothetical protein
MVTANIKGIHLKNIVNFYADMHLYDKNISHTIIVDLSILYTIHFMSIHPKKFDMHCL